MSNIQCLYFIILISYRLYMFLLDFVGASLTSRLLVLMNKVDTMLK